MKMPMGLAAKMGKGMASMKSKPAPGDDDDHAGSSEESYAKEAFSAAQEGDEAGFTKALIATIRACIAKDEEDEYDGEV